MLEYEVKDMTCNHCVNAITQAIKEAAPAARVDVDLDSHRVRVHDAGDAANIQAAIEAAGYHPVAAS